MINKNKENIASGNVAEKKEIIIEGSKTNIGKNPWKVTALILGVIVIILLVFMFRGGITGNVISESSASEKIVEYLNSKTGGGVVLVSSKDTGSLYEVTVSYKGDEIPVYVTKDGNYFVQGAIPITGEVAGETPSENQQPQEVTKSDKPKVEAFIFSYCPYGLQFEKAMVPVYKLLKDKADINLVAIGAMHGEYEKIESLRQLCIQKEYGKDKLWSYLEKFNVDTSIGGCSGDAKCLDPLISKIFTQLSIDKSKINTCMAKDAEALYNNDVARAAELGQSGSPGFVINGVPVQVARTPEAIKQAICSAFNTAPSECQQTLSTESASAGFGASASSSSSSASCG